MGLYRATLAVSLCWLVLCTPARADNVSWDDEASNGQWSDTGNWSPDGSPGGHDISIGDLPQAADVSTTVDADFSIASLTLSGGADIDTAGQLLDVVGPVTISDPGTTLIVTQHTGGPLNPSASVEDLTINSGGALLMAGGRLVLDDPLASAASVAILQNNLGGLVTGHGTIVVGDDELSSATTTLLNDGTLQSSRPAGASAGEHYTLTIRPADANARIDLDGLSGAGVVDVGEETTLDLQVDFPAPFSGTLNLEAGAVLATEFALHTDGATVNVSAGVGGIATVRGNRIGGNATHTTPTTYNVNSGSFVHEEGFELNASSVVNMAAGTTMVFKNIIPGGGFSSDITGTLNFNGPGATLLVDGTSVRIDTPSFDWDGPEDVVTEVRHGSLSIYSGDISPAADDDSYDGTINLFDSDFEPAIPGGWVLGGDINMDSSTVFTSQTSITSDETMTVDGGTIHVAHGYNLLRAPTVFAANSAGGTIVDDDTKLQVERDVTFEGGSTHTGKGTLLFHGSTYTVSGNQALAMSTGVVDLAADPTASEVWNLNARLSVQTSEMDTFGSNTSPVDDIINIHGANGQLAVDIATSDSWTLGQAGVINVTGTTSFATSLSGEDVVVAGQIVVTDSTEFTARLDIATGGMIHINTAGAALRLAGGSYTTPNSISGGTIQGPGQLRATNSTGLAGFGTINADVNFAGNADLRASGGTLSLNGKVLNADQVIVDHGATLQLSQSLDTSTFSILDLGGGTLTGPSIVNNTLTRGRGEIAAGEFVNNGTVHAVGQSNEALVISAAAALDLDGDADTGNVQATAGNLTIASPLSDDFDGTMSVGEGRTLTFQQGWTLGTSGSLQLIGSGANRATLLSGGIGSVLRGSVDVVGTAQIDNTTFHSDVAVDVSLASDLLELTGSSSIHSGAMYTGVGTLQNLATGSLTLQDSSNIGIQLDNRGELTLEGQATVQAFDQSNDATLTIDVFSTSTFGQLIFGSTSTIGGSLQLSLDDGYTATEGDSFNILTGTGGVLGTFTTLTSELPVPGAGLGWEFDYTGAEVILRVIEAGLSGDFNGDGTVNLADYAVWRNHLGAADESALSGNGDNSSGVDSGDYDLWKQHFGSATNSIASGEPVRVPEPASLALFAVAGSTLLISARVSRKCAQASALE